jgi:hypothetical protein
VQSGAAVQFTAFITLLPTASAALHAGDAACASPEEASKALSQLTAVYYGMNRCVDTGATRGVQGVENSQLTVHSMHLTAVARWKAGGGEGLLGSADDDQVRQTDCGLKAKLVGQRQVGVCPVGGVHGKDRAQLNSRHRLNLKHSRQRRAVGGDRG